MTIRVGSGIIKDGLILHLDAADQLNYLLSVVEVLVVAGGGGGGVCYGGGGGGGGVVYSNSYSVTPGTGINVSIGNGGTNQVNVVGNGGPGGNSSFGNLTAIGGGYGGGNCGNAGGSGGSGGGGSGTGSARVSGGTGTPAMGFDGETSIPAGGGGGGGAGSLGFRRAGGNGLPFTISGSIQYYGGGGSGGGPEDMPGGAGGGGMGGTAVASGRADATPNTGGGGGGSIISGSGVSGVGGSGIVIVRYPGPQKATGGNTITYIGGYTIHTFTSAGTFTPYSSVASITGLHDLTGNEHHAVLGTQPSYDSANGGSLVFNGSTQYLRSVTDPKALKNLQGFSLFIWCKCTSTSPSRKYVFDGRGNKIVSEAPPGVGMGFDSGYSDNKIFHFVQAADNTYTEAVSPTTFLNNQIYQLGMVRQPYSSTFQVVDTDSRTLITPSFTAPRMTASASVDIGEYVLGTFSSSTAGAGQNFWWPGNVYCVLAYNRALTQAEVTQNFNALRGRYGL